MRAFAQASNLDYFRSSSSQSKQKFNLATCTFVNTLISSKKYFYQQKLQDKIYPKNLESLTTNSHIQQQLLNERTKRTAPVHQRQIHSSGTGVTIMSTPRNNDELIFNQNNEDVRIGSAAVGVRGGNLIAGFEFDSGRRRITTAGLGSSPRGMTNQNKFQASTILSFNQHHPHHQIAMSDRALLHMQAIEEKRQKSTVRRNGTRHQTMDLETLKLKQGMKSLQKGFESTKILRPSDLNNEAAAILFNGNTSEPTSHQDFATTHIQMPELNLTPIMSQPSGFIYNQDKRLLWYKDLTQSGHAVNQTNEIVPQSVRLSRQHFNQQKNSDVHQLQKIKKLTSKLQVADEFNVETPIDQVQDNIQIGEQVIKDDVFITSYNEQITNLHQQAGKFNFSNQQVLNKRLQEIKSSINVEQLAAQMRSHSHQNIIKGRKSMKFRIISPSQALQSKKRLQEMTKQISENLARDKNKSKTRIMMSGELSISGEDQWNYKRHYKKVGDRTTRASLYMELENKPKNLEEEPGEEESSRLTKCEEKPTFDWSAVEFPKMTRVSSSNQLVNNILDFSQINVKRVDRRTKIDNDFIDKLKKLKNHNGLLEGKQKKYFQEETIDKVLVYQQVDQAMHLKIDSDLLPKKKKSSYFEQMSASQNVGMGPYKLTRYKVWQEPPKLIVVMPSEEEDQKSSQDPSQAINGGINTAEKANKQEINDSKLMNI